MKKIRILLECHILPKVKERKYYFSELLQSLHVAAPKSEITPYFISYFSVQCVYIPLVDLNTMFHFKLPLFWHCSRRYSRF